MIRRALVVATALTLFLFGFPVYLALFSAGTVFYYDVVLFVFDIPLAIAAAAALAILLARRHRLRAGAGLMLALSVALALAWTANPTPAGLQTVLRLAEAGLLAFGLATLEPEERMLAVGALAALAVVEVGISLAQLQHGGPLGLIFLGERQYPFTLYNTVFGPRGTFPHEHLLAALSLVTSALLVREALEQRRPVACAAWTVAAFGAALPIGFSFSRGAALGLALICGALLLGARARPRPTLGAVLALLLGAMIPAAIWSDGWDARRVGGTLGERDVLAGASLVGLVESPVFGIGPARSVDELRRRYTFDPRFDRYQPTHNVPLLAAIEGGPLAGAIAALLLLVPTWRARRSPVALALVGAFLPYLLTDHFAYTHAQGLVLLGIWAGMLDGLSASAAPSHRSAQPRAASPQPS